MLRRLLVVSVLVLAPSAWAQRADTLREQTAVAMALSTSPQARAALAAVQAARAQEAARSNRWAEAPELEADVALPPSLLWEGNEYRAEMGVAFTLEAPSVRQARFAAAAAERAWTEAEQRAALAERGFDVLARYTDASAADAQLRLARLLAADADTLVDAVALRYGAGDVSELDLRLARLDALSAQTERARAEAEALSARLELATLLGQPVDSLGPLVRFEQLAILPSPDTLLEAYPVQAARAAAAAAEADAAYSTRQLVRPALRLRGGVEISRTTYERDGLVADAALWNGFVRLGGSGVELTAGVSIPLVQYGPQSREAQAARAEASSRRAQADALAATTHAQQNAARTRLQNANALRLRYVAARPDVEESLGLLRLAYAGGEMSLTDLLTARARLYATVRDALAADVEARRAAYDAARAAGVLPAGLLPF